MPEGHTLHRLAREHRKVFGGQVVHAESPQGRFDPASIDGHTLHRAEAVGKHLFHHYSGGQVLHIHLGLFGKFTAGTGEPPDPRGALRLRLTTEDAWTDLRGPTACEMVDPLQLTALLARLGPDPLRADAEPDRAFHRISRSSTAIGALLMDQKVVAGIGNVYRAEILFRHGVNPFRAGKLLDRGTWDAMWEDLVVLMKAGVRSGRIVTVRPEDRPRKRGALSRAEAVYVYRRTGLPCRLCGTPVATEVMVGRNLFWCPRCQAV
ncbi:Fpg/Nei family DNA glycosylase [Nakamurella sp. YIM 132087]|uniref:DNA-(apurinic or apyrimidinic site) lyase n=1 Tax=Nakamurella alba TaxID=2665158 RepID=A0A7K1FRB4_9ACTN|nr:DNA-formamidopyrimidine glycosylase family protein [Nakamurella alba]MTD15783.1 Fpg/Nei family DNA glycosylase [Nakamurella alba]